MKPFPSVTLASQSPRRRQLLSQIGIPFICVPTGVDETAVAHPDIVEDPAEVALLRARAKAEAAKPAGGTSAILAADTVVVRGATLLDKPEDREDARRMMTVLAGGTHQVITAVVLSGLDHSRIAEQTVVTDVRFAPITELEMEWYLDVGDWHGVAGAYRIQGVAAVFVEHIAGSYSNVVGLPINTVYSMVRQFLTVT